jgi:hypothetical protein
MNTAYQVTSFAYQGSGVFAYQGSTGITVVIPQTGSNLKWKRRVKRRKYSEVEEIKEPDTIVVEIPTQDLLPRGSLRQVLDEIQKTGYELDEIDEEDDALVLTFIMKTLQ